MEIVSLAVDNSGIEQLLEVIKLILFSIGIDILECQKIFYEEEKLRVEKYLNIK